MEWKDWVDSGKEALDSGKEFVSNVYEGAKEFVGNVYEGAKEFVSNACDNATSAASNAWDNASSYMESTYNNVCSYVSDGCEYVSSKAKTLMNNLNNLTESLKNITTPSGGINQFISSGLSYINGDANAIQSIINNVNEWQQKMEEAEKKAMSLVEGITIPSIGASISNIVSNGQKALEEMKNSINESVNSTIQSIKNKLNPQKETETKYTLEETNGNPVVRADGTIVGTGLRVSRDSTKIYNDKGEVIGTIDRDTRLSVLEETSDGKFKVQLDGKEVYISQADVMINAKDYIPSVEVDLVMSKGSVFTILGQAITNLTGIKLYNNKGSEDGTECWMNYEMAQKLNIAQQQFKNDGYSAIIYDAYRPYSVTEYFRNTFDDFLKNHPELEKTAFGNLGKSWFLAQGVSAHNYGMAVDMGLIDNATGEKLEFPSKIHTLDITSILRLDAWKNSNDEKEKNALYMHDVMTDPNGANCQDLLSEWWHFQLEKSKYLKDVKNKVPYEEPIDIPN